MPTIRSNETIRVKAGPEVAEYLRVEPRRLSRQTTARLPHRDALRTRRLQRSSPYPLGRYWVAETARGGIHIYILVTIALLSYYAYNCFRILCPERGDKGRECVDTVFEREERTGGRKGRGKGGEGRVNRGRKKKSWEPK